MHSADRERVAVRNDFGDHHEARHRSGFEWRNIYDPDGPSYRITTEWTPAATADLVVVKSYGDILRDYRIHPEYKFNGHDQHPCRRDTRGVLQRRRIDLVGPPRLIGKEANNIDEVQAGRYAQLDEIITEYEYPADDRFDQQVMPLLDHLSGRELARLVGTDRRTIDRVRTGQMPRRSLREALCRLANQVLRD